MRLDQCDKEQGFKPLPRGAITKTKANNDGMRDISMRFLFIFAKRFIAGQSLQEALPALKKKKDEGFLTTTDILGESVTNADQSKKAATEYCELLETLARNKLELNVSLKPTQLGLDIKSQLCYENVCKVLDKAAENNAYVRIDMEGSDCTDRTLELVSRWHQGYPRVGAVIQAMLKRSPTDVENLIKEGIGIRLCKGAYKEPSTIAFKDKRDVDMQFAELATRLLNSGVYHGIATHDEKLIEHVKAYAKKHGISKDSFEFQMLYGIRQKMQKDLIDDGWNLRIYMPYGDAWFPYSIRRLRERKENVWFMAKNFFRR